MRAFGRFMTVVACAAIALAIGAALWQMDPASMQVAALVNAQLHNSGVQHEVTAVLLNFRGFDTLLEIAVLLLALIGVLVANGEETVSARTLASTPNAMLHASAARTAPLIVLVAVYLLWAGAHQPGGAFQAAAVLAAGIVLLFISGNLPLLPGPGWRLRMAIALGLLVFLAVAALPSEQGRLLAYPPALAGTLILVIEAALTVSLAVVLAGLYLWLPDENEEAEH